MSSNVAGALAYPLGFITGILFLKIDSLKIRPVRPLSRVSVDLLELLLRCVRCGVELVCRDASFCEAGLSVEPDTSSVFSAAAGFGLAGVFLDV
jgi:hypothetical protein